MGAGSAPESAPRLVAVGEQDSTAHPRAPRITSLVVRAALALALLALAAAILMLTMELTRWREQVPDVLMQSTAWREQMSGALVQSTAWREQVSSVQEQVELLQPSIDSALKATDHVVAETERVRREVRPIVREAGRIDRAVRDTLPRVDAALKRVDSIERRLPAVLNTVQNATLQVERVNDAMPGILKEIRSTRVEAQSLLNQAGRLIQESEHAGQEAGEGAAKGFVTGVLKLPFSVVPRRERGGRGDDHPYHEGLDKEDRRRIREVTATALESGEAGKSYPWNNPDSHNSGTVTVKRVYEGADGSCRDLRYETTFEEGGQGKTFLTMCKKNGQWVAVGPANE